MVLIDHPKLHVVWNGWRYFLLVIRRPADCHLTACGVGPLAVTFPDWGYVLPRERH
jgi:hypothetical protein